SPGGVGLPGPRTDPNSGVACVACPQEAVRRTLGHVHRERVGCGLPDAGLRISEIEHEDGLAVLVVLAGARESHATPESFWTGLSRNTAREEFLCSVRACDLRDESDRLAPDALALALLVDEQLPQEPGPDDPRRVGGDVPTQHDETDRLIVGVDGP